MNVPRPIRVFEIHSAVCPEVIAGPMGWEDLLSQELVRTRFTSGRFFAFLQDLSQASDAALRANRVTRDIEARKYEVLFLAARFATLYLNASPGGIALSHSEWHEGYPPFREVPGTIPLFVESIGGAAPFLTYMLTPPIDLDAAEATLFRARSFTPRFIFADLRPDVFTAKQHLSKADVSRIMENLDYVMVDILDNASRLIWERPDMPQDRSVIPLLLNSEKRTI